MSKALSQGHIHPSFFIKKFRSANIVHPHYAIVTNWNACCPCIFSLSGIILAFF
ncbi:hypothetical protein BY458DRAFT_502207 [Sporodiniella umbellata]|nr:hypothetical protein BY458DRAFT_502207 [Sporodiniella umbellata]